MNEMVRDYFRRHPELRFAALGAQGNRDALDLEPFGVETTYYAAEAHPTLVERYRDANSAAFPGALSLPGWVLSDLYLLPAAIGLIVCPARMLDVPKRKQLCLRGDDLAIAAAYFCAPTLRDGVFVGVSLLSLLPRVLAGAWVKTLTLKMVRAERLRGVVQWGSPALRVHTRMGPLRVVSSVPGTHEFRAKSFVYESDLRDQDAWEQAMARRGSFEVSEHIALDDEERLHALCLRAEQGERILIVPPGRDPGGRVLVRY